METSIQLILFLMTLTGLGAENVANAGDPSVYRTGWSYKYAYQGHVNTSTKDFPAGIQVKADVNFAFLDRQNNIDNVLMKLISPTIRDLRGNVLTEADMEDWTEPIRFERSLDGSIGRVFTRPSHPTDVLNIKKGIASLLQVAIATTRKAETNFTKEETDLGGRCECQYNVRRLAEQGRTERGESWIAFSTKKINTYQKCADRAENFYSPVEPVNCDDKVKVNRYRSVDSPKSLTETFCLIRATLSSTFVQSCVSREKHIINTAAGPMSIMLNRRLTFQSESLSSKLYHSLHDRDLTTDRKGLVFEFNNLQQKEARPQIIYSKVYRLLEALTRSSRMGASDPDLFSSDVPVKFIELVNTFRWVKSFSAFSWMYNTLYNHQPKYQFWLKSALPFISNEHAIAIIKDKIQKKEIEGYNITQILSRVGVTPRPNERMCDQIKEICYLPSVNNSASAYSTCWLAYGNLVHSVCRHDSSCLKQHTKVLQAQYDRFSQEKDMEKLVVTLKTIGNAGVRSFFPQIWQLLRERDRIRPPHPNMVIVSATDALRRMNLNTTEKAKMQKILQEVFADIKTCPEFRLNAFTQLMRTRPSMFQLVAIANIIAKEPKVHVKNFVFTYLANMANRTCPQGEAIQARIILGVLASRGNATGFQPSFTHSLYFTTKVTSPFYQTEENIEIEKGYTPLSFIPRFVNFKNSMNILNYKVNAMEFHLRQEGLLPFLKNMFGPHGSVFHKKSILDFFRQKRSNNQATEELKKINRKLNDRSYKDKPLRLCVSSKLFGSEIEYRVIDKNHPMLKSLNEDGTVKLDVNWLENELRAGLNWTKGAADILLDGMRMIPTSIGLPLQIKLSVGGVMDAVVQQRITTKPFFRLLSWGNQPTKITGALSVRPRFGFSVQAEMRLFYQGSSFGFKYQFNNSMHIPFDHEFIFDLQKQNYTEILRVPNHRKALVKIRLLCRLTYALCLNFLALIHLDGHVTGAKDPEDTSFTNFMGHMDVLSFISNGFNLYYPMTVVLVCLATFFSLGTRCLNCLGFQTFIIEDDLSIEYINEGKDIVRRERRKRETLNGDGRKETWSERAESAKRRLNERSRHSDRSTRSDRDREGQLSKEQATSHTNLTDSDIKYIKYSKLDVENDRVELLAAADYDPEPLTRTGYGAGFGRSSSSRPPQNIFDDI